MTGAILGCDPGPVMSAWCVLSADGKVLAHMKEMNEEFHARLKWVSKYPPFQLKDESGLWHTIGSVAIEKIEAMGMIVGASTFDTCHWAGRFHELCSSLPVRLVTRREVKLHLCGSMRAKDPNVRAALIDKLGPPGNKKSQGATYGLAGDEWSALAIAVTARETTEQNKEAA